MKTAPLTQLAALFLAVALAPTPTMAADDHSAHSQTAHQAADDAMDMDHDMEDAQGGSAPPDARDPHAYSDGYTLDSGKYALPGPRTLRLADEANFGALLIDRLERNHSKHGSATAYDAQAWFGRDFDRLVLKADGEYARGRVQEARTELLWGHAVAPYWDVQAGLRYDSGGNQSRSWLAFGLQGLAPYWFDVDAAFYVGDEGRTALRLAAEYDLLWTQKLIVQPRIEIHAYGKDDPAREIGRGLSNGAVGLRVRYEFSRQFAPYVGVERTSKWGRTGDIADADGQPRHETRWVAGVRFWF